LEDNMAHTFLQKPIATFQGRMTTSASQQRRTRTAIVALLTLTLTPIAFAFGDYVARKAAATFEMAPHCMAREPCEWQPAYLAQNTSN
jgi:hypothetical protein